VAERLFEEIDHTADLTFVVQGADLAELFSRCGRAVFALMVDIEGVCPREHRSLQASGATLTELLHEWLSRLLELFFCDGFVAREITVRKLAPTEMEADLCGEVFERGRHVYLREIKAVTYHALDVSREGAGWRARVTVDV
jgi:SHS2 domain-containing protein